MTRAAKLCRIWLDSLWTFCWTDSWGHTKRSEDVGKWLSKDSPRKKTCKTEINSLLSFSFCTVHIVWKQGNAPWLLLKNDFDQTELKSKWKKAFLKEPYLHWNWRQSLMMAWCYKNKNVWEIAFLCLLVCKTVLFWNYFSCSLVSKIVIFYHPSFFLCWVYFFGIFSCLGVAFHERKKRAICGSQISHMLNLKPEHRLYLWYWAERSRAGNSNQSNPITVLLEMREREEWKEHPIGELKNELK